jgi:hypothetical protein
VRSTGIPLLFLFSKKKVGTQILLNLTSGFREVRASEFGRSLQGEISKSLLNEGERSERLQAVPEDFSEGKTAEF